LPCWAIIVAANVDVAGSSPRGIKMLFFGNGSDIRTIEATIRSVRMKYVEGVMDDLKLVLLSFPLFHEYASKGTDSKRTEQIIVNSFIGTFNVDK
jgi:hypothetical protein